MSMFKGLTDKRTRGGRMLQLALSLAICHLPFIPAGAQEPFERRVVVEEFTGAWCGNCPRGIVGLQRLAEDFGDRVISIAIHTGDPMEIPTYPDVQTDVLPGSGAPSCAINRVKFKLDPYSGSGQRGLFHYGIDLDVAAALEQPAEAKVELTAQWDDAYQMDVRFSVATTFNMDSPSAPYRLALVLTEDGLTGTADNWRQENYFSLGYTPSAGLNYQDDDMQPWRDAPYYVEGVEYNHVPVNTLGIRSGIAGSIAAPIKAYEPQTYTNTVSTLASHAMKLIQDKSRLSAVALLINTETGKLVNAAKTRILGYGESGIQSLTPAPSAKESSYNLCGQRVRSPFHGLCIKGGKKYIAH